jgi:biotin transporter BioY
MAAIAVLVSPGTGYRCSVIAGAVMVGWIAGELVVLSQNSAATDPRSPTEAVYALLGVAMAVLGAELGLRTRRPILGR